MIINLNYKMNDENIDLLDPIIDCKTLETELPISQKLKFQIDKWRTELKNILSGKDNRKIAIVGPCSIHDYDSAINYAKQLSIISEQVKDKLFIIMRTYFEKPRTTIGWKGFLNDPDLNNSCDINKGIRLSRRLLIDINTLGLPVGCEFLDTISPQYFSELITWGAIGARTVESQLHRQLASGLSMPIGFKNGTSGDIKVAKDAIISANNSHVFFGIDKNNLAVRVRTKGNKYCHLILRGGKEPNYYKHVINYISDDIKIIVDCSHGNSEKNYKEQETVLDYLLYQYKCNNYLNVVGFMIESNIHPGSQLLDNPNVLKYGVSITDGCIGLHDTERILMKFNG